MNSRNQKHIVGFVAGVFFLSLIPLYALGFFAHPSVDDYYYGVETAGVWQETGSLGAVMSKSWELMKDSYETWQGNFAAIFLMRLQPGVFGESAYWIAPVILLTSLAVSMLFFFYTALRRLAKAGRPAAWGISLTLTFCAIQFCYKPADSFYWFNGGIYYTFFFALSYVLLGLLILAVKGESNKARALAAIPLAPLAFLIGGGNYSTALSLAVLLGSLLGYTIWRAKRHSGRSETKPKCHSERSEAESKNPLPPLLLAFLPLLASLILSILAPGNAVRQSVTGESAGVVKALLFSFAYGGYSLMEGLKLPVAILWLGLTPVLYHLSRRVPGKYPLPLFVLLFTFGIYASQGTALFYAQGLRMPPRMSNIIYFNAYLFTGFNLFYLCGWLRRRYPGNPLESFGEKLAESPKALLRFSSLVALCFLLSCLGLWKVSEKESGGAAFEVQPLSISAAYSLLKGDAAAYDRQLTERAAFLAAQPEGAEVTVPPLSVYPPALTHSEITADPLDFKNDHLARFYHLGSVRLAP
ncbi:MAG: hypothetical protein IJR95_09100 [Lachnospiraceae bacterium]|nr:hypothetical protein [Lachnospiraceae bacterium]